MFAIMRNFHFERLEFTRRPQVLIYSVR